MIIDSHTYVDEVSALGWIEPSETLLRLIDEAGIAKSVIMTCTNLPGANPDALEYIAGVVSQYPDRLVGYVRLTHPADAETVRLVHKAAEYHASTLCLLTPGLQKLVRIGLRDEQGGLTEFCRRLDLGPLVPFIP